MRKVTDSAAYGGSGCEECGAAEIDPEIKSAFGISVCGRCRRQNADYKLLSRTASKDTFLLSDSDFTMLKFLSKENPRNSKWKPVQLYLQRQLRALSYAKHGNLQGLEAERASRAAKRAERQAASRGTKRQAMSELATGGGDSGEFLELPSGVSIPIAKLEHVSGVASDGAGSSKRRRRHRAGDAAPAGGGGGNSGASFVGAALGISFAPPPLGATGYTSAARAVMPPGRQGEGAHAAAKPQARRTNAAHGATTPPVVGAEDDFEDL